jgi:hypothetical protein
MLTVEPSPAHPLSALAELPAPTRSIPPTVATAVGHHPFLRLVEPTDPGFLAYCNQVALHKGVELDQTVRFGHRVEALVGELLAVEGRNCLPERVVARGRWYQELDTVIHTGPAALTCCEVKTLLGSQPEQWVRKGLAQLTDATNMLREHYYVRHRLILVGLECPMLLPCDWSVGGWNSFDEGRELVIFISFAELFERAVAAGLPVPDRMPGVDDQRVLLHNAELAAAEIDTPMAAAFQRAVVRYRAA